MTKLSNLTEETIRARTKTGDTPLHRAAKTGRISEIPKHLLTTELFMVTNYSFHPETPLHLAARYGHLDKVPKEFLTKETLTASTEYARKESKTGPTPLRNMTPLHTAALYGYADQIPKEFLTPEFLRIEATGYRQTVLHYLAMSKSLDLIPQIYANSDMWNLRDSSGQTPRDVLQSVIEREAYVARVRAEPAMEKQKEKLRSFGCTFDENISKGLASDALDVCVRDLPEVGQASSDDSATKDQMATLWSYGADEMDEIDALCVPATVTPAPTQKPKKQKRAWTILSKLTEDTIRTRTKTGDTPLHLAAKTGRICEIPSQLLQTELFLVRNHDRQNNPHRTPLHIAAMYGYLDQVPLEFLTEETLTVLDKYGRTPLQEAVCSGNVKTIPVRFLTVEFLSSIPDKLDGNTILHYLAFRNQLTELPSNCITPEMLCLKNYNGETPQQILEKYLVRCEMPKQLGSGLRS
jgi:ankyrin repeat protein